MANRYWVGGAGTWDATTTTNWSTTSGGAGGASAPTSADSVFFNSASNATAYAVTIGTNAVAADVSIVGPAVGNVTITSAATSVLNVYGSWTSAATGVAFTTTTGAALNFLATTTGKTITTNNISLGLMSVTFNGVGGGWTLGSAFTVVTQATTITAGAFSTGNFAFTGAAINASGTLTRSVTLGTSTLTLSGTAAWTFTTTTNLTFSGASATINCSGANPSFLGGGLTYGTVNFTNTASGTTVITGTNTFTTLSQSTVAAAGLRSVALSDNQTVSGTLTLSNGAAANRRIFVRSNTVGTSRTLTVATLAALVDVDFRDIVAAGASAASPWTGTRLGNCLNNTNITFNAGVNKYWSTAAGVSANWSGTAWATSSGGAATVNNFPLPQDTCIIDNAGATTGDGLRTGNTVTIDAGWNIGTLSFSGRTVAFNWNQGNQDPFFYGSITLTSSMTLVVLTSPTWTFCGQGVTQNITTAGLTMTFTNITVDSSGGTVKLLDSWTQAVPSGATNASFNLTAGTLDLNGLTLTASTFGNSGSVTRTLAFGTTGKIVLFGSAATIYSGATSTNLTVTGTAPLVQFTYSGATGTRNIVMSALSESQSISVEFLNNATDIVTIQGTNGGYRNIDFTNFNGTITTANSPRVFGNLTLGTSIQTNAFAGTGLQFVSTSGTKTITSNGKSFSCNLTFNGVGGTWQLVDNLTTSTLLTLTAGAVELNNNILSSGKLSSSNTNTRSIAFGTGKIVLTDTSGTMYNIDTATGYTYTGTNRFEFPNGGSGTNRAIYHGITDGTEANSPNIYVTGGSDTVTIHGTGRKYRTVDFTGFSGTHDISSETYIYGDLVLSATGTNSTAQVDAIIFAATSGTKSITSNGKTIQAKIRFNGIGGAWQLQDALTLGTTNALEFYAGTFTTNNFTVTCGKFGNVGTATNRTINLGSSTINCLGYSTTLASFQIDDGTSAITVNAGTSTIYMNETYTGASTQDFYGGNKTYYNLIYSGTETSTIFGSNTFNSISNTVQPLTLSFEAGSTQSSNRFDISGTTGNVVTLNSTLSGTQATLNITNGNRMSQDYVSLEDINVSTTNGLLYATPNSTVGTNVTGVTTTLGEFLNFF